MVVKTGTANSDNLYGTSSNDWLDGKSGSDRLIGYAGNDTLIGGIGIDVLDGGTGIDKLYGGKDNDLYYVDNQKDVIAENYNEGIDGVWSSVSYTLSNNVENLTMAGSSSINGAGNQFNNVMSGNIGANILYGKDGNDSLDGKSGIDRLIGGKGNDTYIIDNSKDIITENYNEGIDTVKSFISSTLNNNVENLTLSAYNISGTGNQLNNTINGNSGNEKLIGNGGNDKLYGQKGNDSLNGGDGNDLLDGDAYLGTIYSGVDTLIGGRGNDSLKGGNGNDTYSFSSNWGKDTISEYTKQGTNSGTDIIKFESGIKLQDLKFSKNNSNLVIENKYTNDRIDVQGHFSTTYSMKIASKIEQIKFSDGTSLTEGDINKIISGSGGDCSSKIITKDNGNNYITAKCGNDVIYALGGNDTVYSGMGNDTVYGGEGCDSLNGESGNDKIYGETQVYDLGSGNDTIKGGDGSDSLYGGNGNDQLLGDSSNDVLYGHKGIDILYAGSGNDTVSGGAGEDGYLFLKGDGHDVIQESYDLSLRHTDDVVQFGPYISRSDLRLSRSGLNLEVDFKNSTDSLTFINQFDIVDSHVEYFSFYNGSVVAVSNLLNA